MKRFLSILLCALLLLAGTAVAEDPGNGYTVLSSLDGFYGIWACCAGNDSIPILVLHPDSTYEAYDWWQLGGETTTGDALLRRGSYTFNAADGAMTLEGNETVYTAKTGLAMEGMETGDGSMMAEPDMSLLLLEAPPAEEDDDSMLFMPLKGAECSLLPAAEALYADYCLWMESAKLATPGDDAPIWCFQQDGSLTTQVIGQENVRSGSYTYDNGLLAVAWADGATQRLLLQYVFMPQDEEAAQPFEGVWNLFDDEADEDEEDYDPEEDGEEEDDAYPPIQYQGQAILSQYLMLGRDLDTGATVYFIISY